MLCSLAYCEPKKTILLRLIRLSENKILSLFVKKNPNRIDFFRFGPFLCFLVYLFFFLFKIDLFFCRPECHAKRHFFISFFYSEEKMQTMTDQLLVDLYIKSEKNNKKLKKKKYLEFFLKLIFKFSYRSGNIGNPVRFCLSSFNQNGI